MYNIHVEIIAALTGRKLVIYLIPRVLPWAMEKLPLRDNLDMLTKQFTIKGDKSLVIAIAIGNCQGQQSALRIETSFVILRLLHYSITGTQLRSRVAVEDALTGLPAGLYIVNCRQCKCRIMRVAK